MESYPLINTWKHILPPPAYDLPQSEIYWIYVYEHIYLISVLAGILFFFIVYSIFTYIKYCLKKSGDETITYKKVFCHSIGILITTIILSILVWFIVYAFINRDMNAIGWETIY
jgi:hypothetical protein